MTLASNMTILELQENGGVVPHLTIRREVLNRRRGHANPIHFQRNPIALTKNVRDRVRLLFEQLLSAFGRFEGFRKI